MTRDLSSNTTTHPVDEAKVMRATYAKMTIGLVLTAFASYVTCSCADVLTYFAYHMWALWSLIGVELILVISITAGLEKLGKNTALGLFVLYSILNGVFFSPLMVMYTATSLTIAFTITAIGFLGLTIIGYTTKKDLSGFGTFFLYALFGLLALLISQFFIHNTVFELCVSGAAILLFGGLTVYDTQQIKEMAYDPNIPTENVSTYGALSLYLDFVNLFLHILKFVGQAKS